jgi:hypothetical protein
MSEQMNQHSVTEANQGRWCSTTAAKKGVPASVKGQNNAMMPRVTVGLVALEAA